MIHAELVFCAYALRENSC